MEQLENKEILKKFQKILEMSKRVEMDDVARSLGMNEAELFENLIEWNQFLPFKIDENYIEVENINYFVKSLDRQFSEWDNLSLEKDNKKSTHFWQKDSQETFPKKKTQDYEKTSNSVQTRKNLKNDKKVPKKELKKEIFDNNLDLEEKGPGLIERYREWREKKQVEGGEIEEQKGDEIEKGPGFFERRAMNKSEKDLELEAYLVFKHGFELYKNNSINEAIKEFKIAIQLNPNYKEAWMNLGSMYHHLKKYIEAETYYLHALQLKSDYTNARLNLGWLYEEQEKWDKAKQCYNEGLNFELDQDIFTERLNNLQQK